MRPPLPSLQVDPDVVDVNRAALVSMESACMPAASVGSSVSTRRSVLGSSRGWRRRTTACRSSTTCQLRLAANEDEVRPSSAGILDLTSDKE